jgi:transcriptional regulator with XRE-family HTH domain
MQPAKRTFHELLRATRLEADQTVEVMAVLLNMTPEEYEALETWKYPDEETLKRLSLMMQWNYYDTQRLIINEMISPNRPAPATAAEAEAAPQPGGENPAEKKEHRQAAFMNTLGERLREVRLITGQSTEIIALMLNLDEAQYLRIEEGEQPPDEVLRRISLIYNWNYQDLISVLRSEHAKNFQPHRVGMPFLGATAHTARFRQISREMEELFGRLSDVDQQIAIAQLELVRDTMRRHQKAS